MCIAITVIVPIYNGEAFLDRCIESIVNQTLKNIEILLVDDSSKDGSIKICERYQKNDRRIIISSSHIRRGVSWARNNAIKNASGEYISFIDCDDFYPSPDILEKLYALAIKSNHEIVGGSESKMIDTSYHGLFFEKEKIITYKQHQHDGGFYRFIYRTKYLRGKNILFPYLHRFQDAIFLMRALDHVQSFYVVPDVVYAYRKGHKTITWTMKALISHTAGVSHALSFSSKKKYGKLHILMIKNSIRSIILKTDCLSFFQRILFARHLFERIDFRLICSEIGYFAAHIYCIKFIFSPVAYYFYKVLR